MTTENKKLQSTTDFGLAAWLIEQKGIKDERNKMVKIKRGKGIFFFELSDADWFELKKEHDESVFCDHENRMSRLKDLTY